MAAAGCVPPLRPMRVSCIISTRYFADGFKQGKASLRGYFFSAGKRAPIGFVGLALIFSAAQ